jgi:DNA-binding LacI/PurR family transcriptional regulator
MAKPGSPPPSKGNTDASTPRRPRSQLATRLIGQIRDVMDTVHNGPLPTEISLAKRFAVSRKSIRSAFAELERTGEIHRVPGKGTFTAKGRASQGLFRTPVKRIGLVGSYGLPAGGGSDGFYLQLFSGLCAEAFDSGAEIILGGGTSVERMSEVCYHMCDSQRIDAVALIAVINDELIAELAQRGKPICLIDHFVDIPGVHCVRMDSRHAAEVAVEHLHMLGHRQIAYAGPIDTRVNPERLNGYREAVTKYALEIDNSLIVDVQNSAMGGASAVGQLLSLPAAKRPTALITFSSEMALGAIRASQKFGLVVPRDFSIVSSGSAALTDSEDLKRITSVVFDPRKLGITAAKMLLKRIDSDTTDDREQNRFTNLPVELRVGQSSSRLGVTSTIFT